MYVETEILAQKKGERVQAVAQITMSMRALPRKSNALLIGGSLTWWRNNSHPIKPMALAGIEERT